MKRGAFRHSPEKMVVVGPLLFLLLFLETRDFPLPFETGTKKSYPNASSSGRSSSIKVVLGRPKPSSSVFTKRKGLAAVACSAAFTECIPRSAGKFKGEAAEGRKEAVAAAAAGC